MHVDIRNVQDVIIVDLSGRLIAGVGDVLLRDVMNRLLADGWKKILLNLGNVTIIDSSGIGEVVASWKVGKSFGSRVWILRPGDRVRHSLHLSQILPLLRVFEDEGEAVAGFAAEDAGAEAVPPTGGE